MPPDDHGAYRAAVNQHRRSTALTRGVALVASVVAGAVLVGACGGDDDDPSGQNSVPSSTGGSDGSGGGSGGSGSIPLPNDDNVPTQTVDLGAGLVAELPEEWELLSSFADGPITGPVDGCTWFQAILDNDAQDQLWELRANSTDCAGVNNDRDVADIGNGDHGYYVTMDDVPDPVDVEEHEVSAGPLTTFTQDYYECTNECNDFDDHVGLLELTDPPDAEYPSVMIVDSRGEMDFNSLVALADAIHPEGG